MRVQILGATLVMTAAALAACGSSDDSNASGGGDDLTHVRIAGNSNAAVLPVWVAQDQGFFKDCGVDAEYTLIENITTLPAALGKSFDLALSVPPLLITAADQGILIEEVAGATLDEPTNPQTFLVVPKGSDIKSIEDMEGKTLGVQTVTGSTHLGTKLWLKQAGVPVDSVKAVQVDGPAQADQLKSGRIDAVETLAPFSTELLKTGTSIGDPQAAIAPTISGIFWTATPKWAKDNPEALDCFREGIAKGADYIAKNEDKARQVLQEQTKMSAELVAGTVLPTYIADVRADDLALWEDAMKEVGGFKGDVDPASIVAQN